MSTPVMDGVLEGIAALRRQCAPEPFTIRMTQQTFDKLTEEVRLLCGPLTFDPAYSGRRMFAGAYIEIVTPPASG